MTGPTTIDSGGPASGCWQSLRDLRSVTSYSLSASTSSSGSVIRRRAGGPECALPLPDEDSARWDGFPFRQGDIVISARARAEQLAPDPVGILKDRNAFFRRGSSGAGRELLTDAEFAQYENRAADLAPEDLLTWLHR